MTDTEIVKQILQGNDILFSILVDRYYNKLIRYAKHILKYNQHDAEDAVSQTFAKVYKNLAGYNPSLQFNSWIYRICHNEAVNIIRKNSKFFTFDPLSSSLQFYTGQKDVEISKLDVEHVLTKLPIKQRNLLVLFYIEEFSIKEIASMLKSTPGSIKTQLSHARSQAKKIAEH